MAYFDFQRQYAYSINIPPEEKAIMYTEGYSQWTKLNKQFAEPMSEWHKVTTELCQRLTEQQLDIMGEHLSRMSNQLKRLTNVRKPEDFINLQKECLSEDVTAAIECMQKVIHTSMENMEEIANICGSALREHGNLPAAKSSERK